MSNMIKRCLTVVMAFAMILALVPGLAQARFSDETQAGPEFIPYIRDLEERGISSGSDGQFFPFNNVTRGEFMKMLVLAAEIPLDSASSQTFSDVPRGHEFFAYVQTAANMNIVSGFTDGTFRPSDLVTRGAAAKMLTGAFQLSANTAGGPHFSDVPTSHDFYTFIETARNANLINGYSNSIFVPQGLLIRAHAAKIVSRALTSEGDAERFVFGFSDFSLPSGTAVLGRAENKVVLEFDDLDSLGRDSDFMYNVWATDDEDEEDGFLFGGEFNLDEEGNFVNERYQRRTNEFDFGTHELDEDTVIVVSIEPIVGESEGSAILAGQMSDGEADLEFPETIAGARGVVLIRGSSDNDVTLEFTNLPDLTDYGFRYEGWAVTNDGMTTLGTFQGLGTGTVRHRVVYNGNLLDEVAKVIVTIEARPDYSTLPTSMEPFEALIGAGTETDDEDDNEDTDVDEDMYLGLTTRQTDISIIQRTIMVMECDDDDEATDEATDEDGVIVQAYATAPNVALDSEVGIVIKISDCDGEPISDLSLQMDQISGLEGEVEDPDEEGTNSGVYIGTYTAPSEADFSGNAGTVTLQIEQDASSDDNVTVPTIEVSFELESSDSVGSASEMEVDVTRDDITIEEEDNDSSGSDAIVIVTLLDSRGKGIEGMQSDIELSGSSDDIDGAQPDANYGSGYIFRLDTDDIIGDRDDASSSITVRETFRIEAIDTSTQVAFLPILRPNEDDDMEEYQIEVTFIPEDDEEEDV